MRLWRYLVVIGLGALLTLSVPGTASAHEVREVLGGKYRIVVGFLNEPVFAGDKSGLDLRVTDNPATTSGAEPDYTGIEGLESTLQAEVIYGDQKLALPLEPRWRDPGAYASYFYPMAVGDYSFHIWGTINGEQVDETFTSGPETFGPVQERIEFPKQAASASSAAGIITDAPGRTGTIATGLIAGFGLGAVSLWFATRLRLRPRRMLHAAGVRASAGD
ncbi:MAG: hypothetical protein C4346_17285 [Chloroflexota bacterium]